MQVNVYHSHGSLWIQEFLYDLEKNSYHHLQDGTVCNLPFTILAATSTARSRIRVHQVNAIQVTRLSRGSGMNKQKSLVVL